jgi:hypothetical protein
MHFSSEDVAAISKLWGCPCEHPYTPPIMPYDLFGWASTLQFVLATSRANDPAAPDMVRGSNLRLLAALSKTT